MRDAELTRYYTDEFRRISLARFVVTGLRVFAATAALGGIVLGFIVAAAGTNELLIQTKLVTSLFYIFGGVFWGIVLLALSAVVDLLAAQHEAHLLAGGVDEDDE